MDCTARRGVLTPCDGKYPKYRRRAACVVGPVCDTNVVSLHIRDDVRIAMDHSLLSLEGKETREASRGRTTCGSHRGITATNFQHRPPPYLPIARPLTINLKLSMSFSLRPFSLPKRASLSILQADITHTLINLHSRIYSKKTKRASSCI